jgi:hypothetical protein
VHWVNWVTRAPAGEAGEVGVGRQDHPHKQQDAVLGLLGSAEGPHAEVAKGGEGHRVLATLRWVRGRN